MMNNTFSCWIDIDCKEYYLDSKKQGLRIVPRKDVDADTKKIIFEYICFLRKKYFFPIRCYVYLTNNRRYKSMDKGYCYGSFFPGEENKSKLPSIYLPCLIEKNNDSIKSLLFNLTCLLTYYYQWYFMLEKDRTHRSLEIEATKMASFLVDLYSKIHHF